MTRWSTTPPLSITSDSRRVSLEFISIIPRLPSRTTGADGLDCEIMLILWSVPTENELVNPNAIGALPQERAGNERGPVWTEPPDGRRLGLDRGNLGNHAGARL